MIFLKFLFVLSTPEVQIIHENTIIIYFYFLKMSVLLYHPHLHQVFTILSLSSIHQLTMNNQFEALNALKFRFLLFISHYLCTQTTSLSFFSLYLSKKKSMILILNFIRFKLWFLVINKCVCFLEKFCVIGKSNQVISLVESTKLIFFSDLFVTRLSCKSSDRRILIRKSSVNKDVSFAIDFICVFRDDFYGSLPTFLC